jgi:hypothetical protein
VTAVGLSAPRTYWFSMSDPHLGNVEPVHVQRHHSPRESPSRSKLSVSDFGYLMVYIWCLRQAGPTMPVVHKQSHSTHPQVTEKKETAADQDFDNVRISPLYSSTI